MSDGLILYHSNSNPSIVVTEDGVQFFDDTGDLVGQISAGGGLFFPDKRP